AKAIFSKMTRAASRWIRFNGQMSSKRKAIGSDTTIVFDKSPHTNNSHASASHDRRCVDLTDRTYASIDPRPKQDASRYDCADAHARHSARSGCTEKNSDATTATQLTKTESSCVAEIKSARMTRKTSPAQTACNSNDTAWNADGLGPKKR